jgi:hypothetical protein
MAKKRPTKRAAPKQESPDDLLTTAQVAAMAGVHAFHMARLLRDGKGPPSIRIGATGKHPGHHVIRRGDALAWLETR